MIPEIIAEAKINDIDGGKSSVNFSGQNIQI